VDKFDTEGSSLLDPPTQGARVTLLAMKYVRNSKEFAAAHAISLKKEV
jgi:hypothetical protein